METFVIAACSVVLYLVAGRGALGGYEKVTGNPASLRSVRKTVTGRGTVGEADFMALFVWLAVLVLWPLFLGLELVAHAMRRTGRSAKTRKVKGVQIHFGETDSEK